MSILIVEDEVIAAGFVLCGLGVHGYVVDVARDGRGSLAFASTGEHMLALLDVTLPSMGIHDLAWRSPRALTHQLQALGMNDSGHETGAEPVLRSGTTRVISKETL